MIPRARQAAFFYLLAFMLPGLGLVLLLMTSRRPRRDHRAWRQAERAAMALYAAWAANALLDAALQWLTDVKFSMLAGGTLFLLGFGLWTGLLWLVRGDTYRLPFL